MKEKNKQPSASDFQADTGKVVDLPLSEIFWNRKWNMRTAAHYSPDAKGDNEGYPGIVSSIAIRTLDGEPFPQRDPVVVRPNPNYDPKRRGEEYRRFLGVSGFQRADAIYFIATQREDEVAILLNPKQGNLTAEEVASLADDAPTIRAFVKTLDEEKAQAENLSENVQRAKLSGPDIGAGVLRMIRTNPSLSDSRLAVILGSNQGYISKMRHIAERTSDVKVPAGALNASSRETTILDAWRELPRKATQNQLKEIADMDSDEKKVKAFLAYSGIQSSEDVEVPVETARGPGAWIENAINKEAPKIGTLLANLEHHGYVTAPARMSDEVVRALYLPFRELPVDVGSKASVKKGTEAVSHDFNMARIKDAITAARSAAKVALETKADGIPSPPESDQSVNGRNGKGGTRRVEA